MGMTRKVRKLDAIDLQLLGSLQENALRTVDELSRHIALSPSAIARRLRRLRASGAIAAEIAILEPGVGPFLSAVIEIKLDRHDLAGVEAFLRRLAASPNVQVLMEVSGAFDLMVVVVARDMDAFNAFADAELASDPAVQRYETRFVKKRRKVTFALPLDQARRA